MNCRLSRPSRAADERGLSLIEVMVAMLVFVIGSLALLTAYTGALHTTTDSRQRVVAANLAASDIDEARSLAYEALKTITYAKSVNGRDFTVSRSVAPVLASGGGTACGAGGSRAQLYKKVSTKVDTAFQGTVSSVRADTLVSAPVVDPNSASGALGASVIDRDGQPVAGADVLLNGNTSLTDEAGCAFVDGVAPGTYNVTASRSGYVNVYGATSVTLSTGFAAGQVTNQQFLLDVPAPVTLVPSVLSASTLLSGYTLPTGLTARLDTPDRATPTRTSLASQPVTVNGAPLLWNAFPATSGYDAYLGTCSTVAHVASLRATAVAQVLPLVPVDVSIVGPPAKVSGQSVLAASAVPGCAETLTFAVTTASNGTAKVAVPPGSWILSLAGRPLTPRPVTLSAGAPSPQTWVVTW